MEQVRARAALAASGLDGGMSTTIARSEIMDALAADEAPIELMLDLTSFSEGKATETRNVAVTWERSDLEQLLSAAQGDEIVLTFDPEALRQAMEDDVEGHGLRETALILTVAAAAAAGTAAGAAAEPGPMLGQAAPIVQSTSPDDRAVARSDVAPNTVVSPDDRAASRADEATPAGPEIPYLSHGQGVTPADLGIPAGTSPDDRAVPRMDPAAPTGLEIPYLSHGQGVTPADLGIATTGETASDSSTFSVPDAGAIAVFGAIALAITGAFFVVGANRRRVRPI